MSTKPEHIGDGAYVQMVDSGAMHIYTDRGGFSDQMVRHWVALEPDAFLNLLRFAYAVGWGGVVQRAAREQKPK